MNATESNEKWDHDLDLAKGDMQWFNGRKIIRNRDYRAHDSDSTEKAWIRRKFKLKQFLLYKKLFFWFSKRSYLPKIGRKQTSFLVFGQVWAEGYI